MRTKSIGVYINESRREKCLAKAIVDREQQVYGVYLALSYSNYGTILISMDSG